MANRIKRLIPLGIVAFVLVVSWRILPKPEPIVQPILYNHNLHIEQEGMECLDCHEYAEEKPFATIPRLAICQDCHDEDPLSESPEEEKLIAHIESGDEIDWRRIYNVPDHVYFSHRRHVSIGEVACSTCHGEVSDQIVPVDGPVTDLTMEWCMDCHRENKITNDCLACHR